jgi:hypothetical protein
LHQDARCCTDHQSDHQVRIYQIDVQTQRSSFSIFVSLFMRHLCSCLVSLSLSLSLSPMQQQMAAEISQLRSECEQLEASLNAYTGEDLSSVTSVVELLELEQRLESAIGKVRARKV